MAKLQECDSACDIGIGDRGLQFSFDLVLMLHQLCMKRIQDRQAALLAHGGALLVRQAFRSFLDGVHGPDHFDDPISHLAFRHERDFIEFPPRVGPAPDRCHGIIGALAIEKPIVCGEAVGQQILGKRQGKPVGAAAWLIWDRLLALV